MVVSGCHSSVAEHWQLKPKALGSTLSGTTFFLKVCRQWQPRLYVIVHVNDLQLTSSWISLCLMLYIFTQVCRMGYEVMQTYHVDASQKYYSLDDIYYFGGEHY